MGLVCPLALPVAPIVPRHHPGRYIGIGRGIEDVGGHWVEVAVVFGYSSCPVLLGLLEQAAVSTRLAGIRVEVTLPICRPQHAVGVNAEFCRSTPDDLFDLRSGRDAP